MSARQIFAAVAFLAANVAAWDDCHFPHVDYVAHDEGVGVSYTYALAAMNGKAYSGGYTKGNFAFVGAKKDGVDVNPEPCQTLWGTTHSDLRHLYIAEMSADGKMTKGWHFLSSANGQSDPGHSTQSNGINSMHGLHRMMATDSNGDYTHVAVTGYFKETLTLPDGVTVWSDADKAHPNSVPFVMKLDVSKDNGVGAGTTGWAKVMDTDFPGGANTISVDGDTDGNMIVVMEGCSSYDATATGTDAYGRPTTGASVGCNYYVKKLASADGAEVWSTTLPKSAAPCRVISDGSFFCGFSTAADTTLNFGNSVTLTGTGSKVGIVKFDSDGKAVWAKEAHSTAYNGDLSVNKDGTLLAVKASGSGRGQPAHVLRIDTSTGNEGNVLWSDAGGVGSHGFRGVEVTHDPNAAVQEVVVFGQVGCSGSCPALTITDTAGASTTLRARGGASMGGESIYDVYVLAYDASNGAGKYAFDAGGGGMEYFFAFASDPVTQDIYVGGTSRSEIMQWGEVTRDNQLYTGESRSSVGSSKAFFAKFKTTTDLPSCLESCSADGATKVVKAGHCYVDRYCYEHGAYAVYHGAQCMHCDANSNQQQWSGPDTTDFCMIDGMCYDKDEHKSTTVGRRTVMSECESCQPSTGVTNLFMMVPGYQMVDGACHKPSWAEEAAAAGWREPCAQASRSRRSRKLAQLEEAKEGANPASRKLFKTVSKDAKYASTDDDDEL